MKSGWVGGKNHCYTGIFLCLQLWCVCTQTCISIILKRDIVFSQICMRIYSVRHSLALYLWFWITFHICKKISFPVQIQYYRHAILPLVWREVKQCWWKWRSKNLLRRIQLKNECWTKWSMSSVRIQKINHEVKKEKTIVQRHPLTRYFKFWV